MDAIILAICRTSLPVFRNRREKRGAPPKPPVRRGFHGCGTDVEWAASRRILRLKIVGVSPTCSMNGGVMIKKVVPGVCFCFVFITFVCASLAAQGPQIAIVQRSPIVEPANGPEKGLTKIHSNLGSKTDAFDDGVSWSITGPDNPRWGEGYLAMPFTPKAKFHGEGSPDRAWLIQQGLDQHFHRCGWRTRQAA